MFPTPSDPPATASPDPHTPPVPTADRAKKRGRLFYIGVAGVVIGGICCLVGLVALLVSAIMKFTPAPAAVLLGFVWLP